MIKRLLWKRDGDRAVLKAKLDRAIVALAKSIGSIVADDSVDQNAMLGRTFGQFLAHVNPRASIQEVAKLHQIFKNDSERAEPDLSNSDAGMPDRRRRRRDDEAARLAAEMDTDADHDRDDDEDEDNFEKGESIMESQLIDLAKRHGWRSVCKNFVDRGIGADVFSETEVTQLLTAVARKMHPDLSADVAFSKAYSEQTPDGELMRRTTQAARDAQFASRMGKAAGSSAPSTPHFLADGSVPTMSPGKATLKPRSSGFSGKPAQQGPNNPRLSIAQLQALIDAQRAEADDDESAEGGEHYEKLLKLAEQAHAAQPEQSVAQHFAKIFSSREHRELAMAERKANRPVASRT